MTIAFSRARDRRHLARRRAAAEACGITDLEEWTSFTKGRGLKGRKGDLEVDIRSFRRGKTMRGTRVVVKPLDGAAGLRLRVEDVGTAILKTMGTREVELGDEAFDKRFLIEGPGPRAFAVLDADTRKAVRAAMSRDVVVADASGPYTVPGEAELVNGELHVDLRESGVYRLADKLPGALRTILRAADILASPRDIAGTLASNALQDPIAEVRLGNLKTLVREFPVQAAAGPVLRQCCDDSDDEICLYAAASLGEEGRATLLRVAFGGPWPQRPAAHEPVAARSVAALGAALPADRALQALTEMLERGRLPTACACIDSLALEGRGAAVAGCEGALLEALSHADGGVRTCAARALGSVGSAGAVLPLREAGERFAGDLRGAARQAIGQIQSRLGGASPGQVSIAAGSTGQVSLADGGGEVSLHRDD